MVNPLVKDLESGRSTLISIRYDSKFREIDYKLWQQVIQPEFFDSKNTGLVNIRNKKLEERIKKEKLEKEQQATLDPKAKIDPKAKAAAVKPSAKKEEEKPITNAKPVKKTQQQIEEEEAEERRLKAEAEEAERRRQQELEAAFNKEAFLRQMGGVVFDFEKESEYSRT